MQKRKVLNIGIIYGGRFPWNRGVGQLHDILETMGHRLTILSLAPEKRFFNKRDNRYRVNSIRKSESYLDRAKTYPFSVNWFWKRFILDNARKNGLECLFVRETHLLRQALWVAKKLHIPCFVDMRENLGLFCKISKQKKHMMLIQNKRFINQLESSLLPKCNHVFTVTQELREWLIGEYDIDADNVSVLGNYPESDFLLKAERLRSKAKRTASSSTKLVFLGLLSINKGIQDVIKSLPIVHKKHRCTLTIIGNGGYVTTLQKIVEDLNLRASVRFEPLLPPEKVADALSRFDIGTCPYLLNEFTHQTMPGKLFEYMAVGLPVLSSARKPVVRIIMKERNGIVYQSRDPEEIGKQLIYMIENPDRCKSMGERGRKAVFEYYNSNTSLKVIEKAFARYFD